MPNIKRNKPIKKKVKKKHVQALISPLQELALTSQQGLSARVKSSKMTQYSQMSKKELLTQYQSFQMSYARSIALPEFARGARLPSIFPQPTATIHKHVTIPVTTSINGKAAIVWQPYFLQEIGQPASSSFYVNNSSNLNLLTPEITTGYTPINIQFGIPANTFSAYRLVSASIKVDPQGSLQQAAGSIAGGIAVYANQAGVNPTATNAFLFGGEMTVASNIDNLLYFNKANVTEQQSIRHIFFPLDVSYETYTPINYPHGTSANLSEINTEFYFAYYITGAAASASFTVELYINFECMPTPAGESYIAISPYMGTEDSSKVIKSVTFRPSVITQASNHVTDLLLEEDKDFVMAQKNPKYNGPKEKGFLNDMMSFLNDNGASIMSLANGVMGLF